MLNNNEEKILDFIKKQIRENGYPPSVREICAAVGLKSTSSVHLYLTRIQVKQRVLRFRKVNQVTWDDQFSFYACGIHGRPCPPFSYANKKILNAWAKLISYFVA